ncbi:MAG: FtsX-like permease family protein [Ekhidna sp.]|uniref:ABC transporter permease n=1 Tax=Ekhidna sp. TaxID=2608089 RepID=UPI0032ED4E81
MKHTSSPPKLAERLLKWYAGRADLEDLQGDLDEVYGLTLEDSGKLRADCNYWMQVLSLLFSYGLKKRKSKAAYSPFYHKNSIAMFKNYFKIAIRNFSKHRLFTGLNILGLSLGMCICLLGLSMSVAIYETDGWQANKDRIYQINTYVSDEAQDKTYASTFHALGYHIKEKYPFIEEVVKMKSGFEPEINHHGNQMNFDGYFADNSFLQVFSFRLIKGDQRSALSKPFSIVITEKVAETLFRDEDPIGKTLETNYGVMNVTGVIENPKQTHFYYQVLASFNTYQQLEDDKLKNDWVSYRNNYVYALLGEGHTDDQLAEALRQSSEKAGLFNPEKEIKLEYISLDNVVPRWNISNAIGIGWDQPSLIFFMVIGLLVLLPAVFNYTNLSIARALKRAKEIGIRKVVGAEKFQIKAQFIVETIILSVLALIGSLLILYPMKAEFLDMIIAAEVLDTDPSISQILTFLLFAITVGIFAGIFPAQYFARLNPIQTMKGEIKNGKSNVSGFKKGLFVFQFFLSLVFVIGVVAIARQHAYVLNQNHGFESENILAVPFERIDKQIAINELGSHPDVKAITTSSNLPGVFLGQAIKATSNQQDTIEVNEVFIGDDFIENMKMKLSWGESQSMERSNQNEELVLVNEQFIRSQKVFNVQKDTLRFTLENGTNCRIVGILKDFNFEPLSEQINPLIFRHSLEESQYALLSVSSTNIKRTINELDAIWQGIDQNVKFEATFLDDEIEDAYYFLRVQIKFFSVLSTLAITISCLGLLGMVSYTTENRTKEIAIRKIMGATDGSLYYLLTKDFIKLILISALIAIPVSYVFYDKLFLYFLIRYGTGLGVLEIFVSITFLFLVGITSIYWQTSRVTKANPATKLRYE